MICVALRPIKSHFYPDLHQLQFEMKDVCVSFKALLYVICVLTLRPIKSHFYPDLHQLQFEIEDGVTPEGHRVRYGYDENIFPNYSWRGYAILTDVQVRKLLL